MIDLLYHFNIITKTGRINPHYYKLIKEHPDIFQQIIELTSFCSKNATWPERIFCITNNIQSIPSCINCGIDIRYKSNTKQRYSTFCSYKCAYTSHEVKQKRKQTWLEKYGVIHPSKSKKIQEKIKQTNLKKYGIEWNISSRQSKEKQIQTCLKKYGVDNVFKSDGIKEKIKQTNLKRYGVENPRQSKQIEEKIKQTNLKKYGAEYPHQTNEVKSKIKQRLLEKYGVEHNKQKHLSIYCLEKLNNPNWLKEQHCELKKSLVQIAFEIGCGSACLGTYFKKYGIHVMPYTFSQQAIQWIESIMLQENIFIQHAQNIGEYYIPCTRLHVDGYCEGMNTIYEFYGDYYHGNPDIFEPGYETFFYKTAGELYQNTLERENKIKQLGYNLVTIWESEWNKQVAV
ncbi:MAG: DUF7487 domain-containing protein [Nitrosopumilaceae archaeon]